MTRDEKFMQAALTEARKGTGRTHPNPIVGAVIVRNGRIAAQGWHHGPGRPHAEVEAINQLEGKQTKGAILYVTLEPCSTHGRTPPCTDAIIRAGFARVVYGAVDPNPKHAGRAQKIFQRAGTAVTTGVLDAKCAALNTAWNKWMATGLPYVVAKVGMTLDGQIGSPPGDRWITSEASRRDAMRLRAASQAILVGGETVRVDNPRLTVRGIRGAKQPLRAIWTKSGRVPKEAVLFQDELKEHTLVFKNLSLPATLRKLGERGVACVLIEGGASVLGEAFDRQLVDEVCFYMAPILTGGLTPTVSGKGVASNDTAIRLTDVVYSLIGEDVKIKAKVTYPSPLQERRISATRN